MIDPRKYLRLEVENKAEGLVNLLNNPDGDLGGWGWITPLSGTALRSVTHSDGAVALEYTATAATGQIVRSELLPTVPGDYVRMGWSILAWSASMSWRRVEFEWFNAAKATLGVSPSTWIATAAQRAEFQPASPAPAGAVYVQLRIQFGSSNVGAAPVNGATFRFRGVIVAVSQSSAALGASYTQRAANGGSQYAYANGYGYTAANAQTVVARVAPSGSGIDGTSGGWAARALRAAGQGQGTVSVYTEKVPVTAGTTYVVSANISGRQTPRGGTLEWLNAASAVLSSSPKSILYEPGPSWTVTAPTGATQVRVLLEATATETAPAWMDEFSVRTSSDASNGPPGYWSGDTADTAAWDYAWAGTPGQSASTAKPVGTGLGYIEPTTYTDVLDSALEVHTVRAPLDAGTLTATIRDTDLDPATADLIRPGRRVRLQVLGGLDNLMPDPYMDVSGWAGMTYANGYGSVDAGGSSYSPDTAAPSTATARAGVLVRNLTGAEVTVQARIRPTVNGSFAGAHIPDWTTITLASGKVATIDLEEQLQSPETGFRVYLVTAPGVQVLYAESYVADWTPIYAGRLDQGSTAYDLKAKPSKQVTISLSALDANAALANVLAPNGVGSIAALPYVLEGAGVPWDVDGSGNQVPTASVVAVNDNASVLDQVAITRDTGLGYAWLNRSGVLMVRSSRTVNPYGADTVLDEADYSDIDLAFDTANVINVVTVNLVRINPATGETEEVPYGPYVDAASFKEWGPRSATFTVQGITDISTYAATILAANAQPKVTVRSLTVPIRSIADLNRTKALADLYDRVLVLNAARGINQRPRVTQVEQQITAKRWTLTLSFDTDAVVASPTVAPPINGTTSDVAPTAIPLLSGFTATFENPGVSKVAGQVEFVGMVQGTFAASAVVRIVAPGGVPAACRPLLRKDYQTSGHTAASAPKLLVNTDGSLDIVTGPSAPAYVSLDVARYRN